MDSAKITSRLRRCFEQGHRIVFWRDQDGEFEDMLDALSLDNVTIIRLSESPLLQVKVTVELEQPEQKFILYETGPVPEPDKDWLLDIRLYADPFAADRSTMILKDLGLYHQSLREHIAARGKFFKNEKERVAPLRKLLNPKDDETAIDFKIMAVLLRIDHSDYFAIVRSLFHGIPLYDLDNVPPVWSSFEKFGVADAFWTAAASYFGYVEERPSLKNLLIRLMVTDFAHGISGKIPQALKNLLLPPDNRSNAVVCIGQWRDSASCHSSFDALSAAVADTIKLGDHIGGFELENVQNVKTFLEVEKHIASLLCYRVIKAAAVIQVEAIREIASRRLDGYWANDKLPSSENAPRMTLSKVYDALVKAAEFFNLKNQYADGFNFASTKAFFEAYAQELYHFDQYYRHFCEAADFAEAKAWDILKPLRDKIEDAYGNWYITDLSLKWGQQVEGGLLTDWKISGVENQQKFFERYIQPKLAKADDRRVFVIISDAFRYEAAQELVDQLNGKYRFAASLQCLLGVLPSYTGLGMAALLPHKEISYSDKGTVLIDGCSSSGLVNRQKILDSVKGVAVKADKFMAMNKADGREFIKPYRVVYIYHNQIDQTADTGNEEKTFNAVRTTIDELENLVSRIINNFNGNFIAVTADHGFLYQERSPTLTDKNTITDKPIGAIISKKRYIIGKNLPENDKAYHGAIAETAGAVDDMEFWVPKGSNRFHFVGGARFVHGGAMLQEIVVPLVNVSQLRGKSAQKTKIKHVGISILGNSLKVTSNRFRLNFIQTEAISDRVKPLTVKVAIYENDDPVTNVETVTFDNTSTDMNEWKKEIWLTLVSRPNHHFDKKKNYKLILRNASTGVEETRMDVTISLVIENDF